MKNADTLSLARELQPWLSQTRRELHARAEWGFELPRTLEYVEKTLTGLGIDHRPCGRAGLLADIGRGEPCFLLRSDMDALPMAEQSGEDFASASDACHACGHDMHTAMLLGAARLLREKESLLPGRVRLMFQPAEELLEGAKDMMAAGALEGVGGAMMLHVMSAVPYSTGTVLLPRPGVSAPGADFFRLKLLGRACHGSAPEKGADPITAAAHILTALQAIKARELPMEERAALSFGSIHGGEAANVIAGELVLEGSLRAFSEDARSLMKKRLAEISACVASAFGVEAKLDFTRGCPGLIIDGNMRSLARRSAEKIGCRLLDAPRSSSGSEDFAYVSREVPTVMAALAAGSLEDGFLHPLHHPAVRFDEAALPVGAALLAATALEFLHNFFQPVKKTSLPSCETEQRGRMQGGKGPLHV